MTAWQGANFGVALKALAQKIEPGRAALIHGEQVVSWARLDEVTDRIAQSLRDHGLRPGDVAGQMLRNSPDYMLAYFGCIKAGLTPVNVNYHYKERELADIFARFGLKALFVEKDFAQVARAALSDQAHMFDVSAREWAHMQKTPLPADFAIHDDAEALFFTATGGTTGMPKAVMWPFSAAWQAFSISNFQKGLAQPPVVTQSLEEQALEAAAMGPDHPASSSPMLLLSPLMHGAGQFSAVIHLLKGGSLATLPAARFDADLAIDEIARLRAKGIFIVGDAFALPLADQLAARDDASQALDALRMITSSGAVFSEANKLRLLAHNPQMMIIDALGSSESSGTAVVITTAAGSSGSGRFTALPGRATKLFDADGREIKPGEEGIGIVARSGPLPLGYLGEEARNAQTFPVIDGQRYLMTGDQARWSKDGTLEFIGRDNMCINTGGEKVFPEEVEAVLQAHERVRDVRVVSLPDRRFGRKVVAVVQPSGSAEGLAEALDIAARAGLAPYKIPRAYIFDDATLRLNNGKPDYKRAQQLADASVSED